MRILVKIFCLTFAFSLHAQVNNQEKYGLMVEDRRQLQSKFSVCQAKIYAAPDLAPAAAHLEMEQVNKEIDKLAKDLAAFEQSRFALWNNEQYWTVYLKSGKKMSFWSAGPSARFAVEKLKAQLNKMASFQVAIAGPFKRPDLNTSQQALDAIRATLEIDLELQRMVKQYLNK